MWSRGTTFCSLRCPGNANGLAEPDKEPQDLVVWTGFQSSCWALRREECEGQRGPGNGCFPVSPVSLEANPKR